jgi:hypothetical protein
VRLRPALAVVVFIGGCADPRLCSPELVAPVGQWDFTSNGGGALLVNGINEDPFFAFTRPGSAWPLVTGRLGGYGLRFAGDSLGSCLPEWADVRIDGQTPAVEREWSTIPAPVCETAGCPPSRRALDLTFRWTPLHGGAVRAEVQFGSLRRDLSFVVSEFADEPVLAVIPRHCRHIERVDSESWLCDRFLSRNGEIVSEWPNGTLVEHLGDGGFAAWKDDSVTFWSFGDGGLVRGPSLGVGFPPSQRGSFLGRYGEDRLVVDGAERVAIAQYDGGWATAFDVPFDGDVAVVEDSLLWVSSRDAGSFQVCLGTAPGLNCEAHPGFPFGLGGDGVWYSRTDFDVNLIALRDGGLATSSIVVGEKGTGFTLLQGWDTSLEEAVLPRRQRGVGLGNTGSCLLFEPEGDELRPVLLPENDFDETVRAIGDGSNGLRWCTGSTRRNTYVYSAPRLR